MVDIHAQLDEHGEGDKLSGIGRVSSIRGGYSCTGGDVRGEGDTLYGIGRVGGYLTQYRWICTKCMHSKEGAEQRAGANIILDMFHLAFKN
jgi:hypothetical protein